MDYISYIREMVGNNKIILNACGCIISLDNKILLQRRSDNGYWGLPGGCMELCETVSDCARREVLEETGLSVNLDYLVGVYNNFDMVWPNKDMAHVVSFIFKASVVAGTLTLSDESLELRYFALDELPELKYSDHINAINDFKNNKKNIMEE